MTADLLNGMTNLGIAGVLAYIVWYQIKNTREIQDKYLEITTRNIQVMDAMVSRIEGVDKKLEGGFIKCPIVEGKKYNLKSQTI